MAEVHGQRPMSVSCSPTTAKVRMEGSPRTVRKAYAVNGSKDRWELRESGGNAVTLREYTQGQRLRTPNDAWMPLDEIVLVPKVGFEPTLPVSGNGSELVAARGAPYHPVPFSAIVSTTRRSFVTLNALRYRSVTLRSRPH